jgi:hypothetical protein
MKSMHAYFLLFTFVCALAQPSHFARAQGSQAEDETLAAKEPAVVDDESAPEEKTDDLDTAVIETDAVPVAGEEVSEQSTETSAAVESSEKGPVDSDPTPKEAELEGNAIRPAHENPEQAPPTEPKDYNGAREPDVLDKSIEKFRTPVDRLTEHYLGSASRAVRFDWRNSLFSLGVIGSELLERNTFGSFRLGGLVRKSFAGAMGEIAATYVFVLSTESSNVLALTPYRQPSRPSRVEIDLNLSYPLFEGVVTPLFDFLPASEMVFSVTGGARYLFYYEVAMGDRNWASSTTWTNTATYQDISQSLGTAQLLDEDKTRLEEDALGGMAIDPALVHTLVGFTFDTYYQPGLFFSGRALVGVPVLAAASGTQLGFWWEMTLAAGWAF